MSVMLLLPITPSGLVLSASQGPFAYSEGRGGTLGTTPKPDRGIIPPAPGSVKCRNWRNLSVPQGSKGNSGCS